MKIWWCQEHGIGDATEPLPKFCWLSLAQRAPRPCRFVPMRLIPDNAEILRDDLRGDFLKREATPTLQTDRPTSDEVRSYVRNGSVTGWTEDYPVAAEWLSQFADQIDGETP